MANKYLDYTGLQRLVAKIKELFVAKESGKGLSTNDYTTTEKTKLSGIAAGAEVNQNAYSSVVADTTTLAASSKTDTLSILAGSNITLSVNAANKSITINGQSGAVQSDWNQSDSTKMDFIKNKPDLSLKANLASPNFTGTPTAPTAAAGTNTTQLATTAFVKSAVDSAVSGAYKPQGSITFANIPTTGFAVGYVYNISDDFTTDSRFVEGAGKTYPAGTNIVCVSTTATAKWDVLSGFVDLSNYLKTTDMVPITNAEIDAEFA